MTNKARNTIIMYVWDKTLTEVAKEGTTTSVWMKLKSL